MPRISLPLCLFAFLLTCLQTKSQDLFETLKKSENVVLLGDSITHAGKFSVYLDSWLLTHPDLPRPPRMLNLGLPSETVSGLSEEGHAGGKFPRPVLSERLERVLEATRPNLVLACYGMNCGIYLPLDEGRFANYQKGILDLRKAVTARGAKLIHATPACYDDALGKKDFSYNDVLGHYSKWLVDQRSRGWMVVDLNTPMSRELQLQRTKDPKFTFQPDAVHPNEEGHWFIARQWMIAFGDTHAAQWQSPKDYLDARKLSPETMALIEQRMKVLRDSYLATAGHQRPGMPKGLPLQEALQQADQLTQQIQAKLSQR
ncbi:MAG: SGNH/GDSL hydrolase family protein [Pirellulales bacterium]